MRAPLAPIHRPADSDDTREALLSPTSPLTSADYASAAQSTFTPSLISGVWLHATVALFALASTTGLVFGGFSLLGDKYEQPDSKYGSIGAPQAHIMNAATVTGVQFVLAGAFFAPAACAWLLIVSAQRVHATGASFAFAGAAAVAAMAIAISSWAWTDLIDATNTYNVGEVFSGGTKPDTLKQFLGGLVFAAFIPLALTAVVVAASFSRRACSNCLRSFGDAMPASKDARRSFVSSVVAALSARAPAPASPRDYAPSRLSHNCGGIAGLALLLVLWFASTTIFTCVWNYSATSYFQSSSPYSLFDPIVVTFGVASSAPFSVQPVLNVKVYEDVVVYFLFVGALAVLGVVGTYNPLLRHALHKRVSPEALFCGRSSHSRDHSSPLKKRGVVVRAIYYFFPEGAAVGELIVVSAIAGLYAYWVYYWTYKYDRITNEVTSYNDAFPNTHIAARVFGHLLTLTMSFLIFPVLRNSVFESVFGVPFDRAMKYHRALGTLCWVLVTVHMLLFQYKWLREGTLLHNVFAVEELQPTVCTATNTPCFTNSSGTYGPLSTPTSFLCGNVSGAAAACLPCPCTYFSATSLDPQGAPLVIVSSLAHIDNFTVPLVEFAWLLLTVSLIVGVWLRRKHYAAFQVTHYAVYVFYAAGLVHAWSHWYYTAGGLLLLAVDKLFRTVDAARVVRVLSLDAGHEMTRVVLDAAFLRGRSFFAGQYAWVNIPSIATGEWHPFTVASAPAAALNVKGVARANAMPPHVAFYVKENHAGSWTSRLARLAESQQSFADLEISVDGPYGRAPEFDDADTVVMFAGGIGVTPYLSMLNELVARATLPARGGLSCPNLRRVLLVWAVRDPAIFLVMAEQLEPLLQSKLVTLSLFVTRAERNPVPPAFKPLAAALTDAHAADHSNLHRVYEQCLSIAQNGRPPVEKIIGGLVKDAAAFAASDAAAPSGLNETAGLSLNVLHSDEQGPSSGSVVAMVCGPAELSHEVSEAAFKHSIEFHSEVFAF